jgi:cyclopropane-fatty-acyl-phospholipid synthase
MDGLDVMITPLKVRAAPGELVRRIHAQLADRGVAIPVRLWDGTLLGPDDAAYRLVLRHPWSLRAMLVPPTDRAAGEAYVRGDIAVEGSLVAALHDVAAHRERITLPWGERMALAREVLSLPAPPETDGDGRAVLRGGTHTKERDEQSVRHHYDVGNDFYRLFLGETLVYSCAYFSDEDHARPVEHSAALDRAQTRKLDLVCRKLALREGERFLDIGCGWGSLVLHAASRYGVQAVGVTLSPAQAALARERVARAGLTDRVEIREEDYRDVAGTYHAVASVGMFEHVGESMYATYFARAWELTRPGGRFLNHAITTGRRVEVRDLSADKGSFVGTHVFPDGTLAPAHVQVRRMEEAGFELLDVQQLRRHYARTLRHWLANLERHEEEAIASAGVGRYRTWRAYMAGSVVGFETSDLGLVQVLGAKGDAPLPLGRRWMEPDA